MLGISIDATELEQFAKAIELFPERVEQALAQAMPEAEEIVHTEMIEHPAEIPAPVDGITNVNWASKRQRSAYHYTQGFGHGDPELGDKYIGQGLLDGALQNTPTEIAPGLVKGSVVSIEYWVKYVIGEAKDQSPIHEGRWSNLSQIRNRVAVPVVNVFRKSINQLVESFKI